MKSILVKLLLCSLSLLPFGLVGCCYCTSWINPGNLLQEKGVKVETLSENRNPQNVNSPVVIKKEI